MSPSFKDKIRHSVFFRFESFLILAAIVFGIIGSYIQNNINKSHEQEISRKYEMVRVLASNSKLSVGSVLSKENLQVIGILRKNLTSNILTLNNYAKIRGKVLNVDLLPGDVLLYSMLKDVDKYKSSFANKIPTGKRLYTLTYTQNPGPAGELSPGDHVDIIVDSSFPRKGRTVFTLLENIIIRAVGKFTSSSKSYRKNNISFYVTAEEMERLSFAQANGSFYISLRNPFDKSFIENKAGYDLERFLMSKNVYESAQPSVEINFQDKENNKGKE
jgi:pilus assembly protein CpaB